MFDGVRTLFIYCLLLVFIQPLMAQEQPCATQFDAVQLRQLREFQSRLNGNSGLILNAGISYVPIQFHIVGNAKGIGYYSITNLLTALCEVNTRFEPTGFHFYLNGPVNYINSDKLYAGEIEAVWTEAADAKDHQAVNVFFHGSGSQWCGVYFSGSDLILVKNNCQSPGGITLTHELGHFFGLPHTFSGWENGNTDPNPERVDGSNCRTAGDGFCDTGPDYISTRWACPYPFFLKDPANVEFKPDSSFYMNYASDGCQTRFSNEQMATMQNNLSSRAIAKPTPDLRLLTPPMKVYPANADSNLNPAGVKLVWNKVEGAFAYHVQVARFGFWEYLNFDQLVTDTSAVAKLYGTWPYTWRVRAIAAGNACSAFGVVDSFTTKEVPAGIHPVLMHDPGVGIINPIHVGESLQLEVEEDMEIHLMDATGKTGLHYLATKKDRIQSELSTPGIYYLLIHHNNRRISKKILVIPAP